MTATADDDGAIRGAAKIIKKLSPTHRDIHIEVGPGGTDELRLDHYLATVLPSLSRTLIKRWLVEGHCRYNGKPAKPSLRVGREAVIDLHVPLPPNPLDRNLEPDELSILYEDGGILIINKPPGQLAHQAGRVLQGTALNQVQDLLASRGLDPLEARLVNRIDRDTSGILVAALDAETNRRLSLSLQNGDFHKTYLALCHAVPEPRHGHWREAIRDDPEGRSIARQCHPEGQASHTEYEVLEDADGCYSLLRITLHTGRQHQIRVHASYHGHPLIGDWTYGPACEELPGQALHAAELRFPHPCSGREVVVSAPLPTLLAELWQRLRAGHRLQERALDEEEHRRLGSCAEPDPAGLIDGEWRRPSWLDDAELARLQAEEKRA